MRMKVKFKEKENHCQIASAEPLKLFLQASSWVLRNDNCTNIKPKNRGISAN